MGARTSRFPGRSPGRPKGRGGRTRALLAFDRFLAEAETIEKLREAWKKELDRDPLGFWMDLVVPLLPKNDDSVLHAVNVSPTMYGTDSIVLAMDKATVPTVIGHRIRMPVI